MKSKYICSECDREFPWNEYQHQSDVFCSECGGFILEITEDLEPKSSVNQFSETNVPPTVSTTMKPYLISCKSCSHQFSKRAESCPKCGWKPQVMCQICHKKIPFDSTVCPDCGDPSPFAAEDVKEQKTNNTTELASYSSKQNSEQPDTAKNTRSHEFSLSWFLFSFDGRINRQAFWYAYPIIFFLGLLLYVALELAKESMNLIGLLIVVTITILFSWPAFAIQVKRWHDINKSGNWIFLNMIPIIGFLWVMVELGFLKGTVGNNDYGIDPLSN